jgi:hypothetical protein
MIVSICIDEKYLRIVRDKMNVLSEVYKNGGFYWIEVYDNELEQLIEVGREYERSAE